MKDIAKEIILFIRQHIFLPENDNLQHVIDKIEAEVLKAWIEGWDDSTRYYSDVEKFKEYGDKFDTLTKKLEEFNNPK